jgi:hypothetical protein
MIRPAEVRAATMTGTRSRICVKRSVLEIGHRLTADHSLTYELAFTWPRRADDGEDLEVMRLERLNQLQQDVGGFHALV